MASTLKVWIDSLLAEKICCYSCWGEIWNQQRKPTGLFLTINWIRDNKQGTCMSIVVAIPANRNVIKKILETIFKYKEVKIEIQRMCNVTPIITGETWTISDSLTQYLRNIPGIWNGGIIETSHIGHCTQTAGSVDVKYKIYFSCEIIFRVAQTVNTEQLQH